MTQTYIQLMKDLQARKFAPIYYLMGEESYYIDKVSDFIAGNVLAEEERDFNQTVVFGSDVSMQQVVEYAKRYPMMAERQVVIVKESQGIKSMDMLEQYIQKPMTSTVLVFCHKNGSLDKRKKVATLLTKSDAAVVFESKKLKDTELPAFIMSYLSEQDIKIDNKSVHIIAESIGSDLNRMTSELDKLKIGLPDDRTITPEIVEQKIGVSKDFNAFELRNAIVTKNVFKANQIIDYFDKNPKAGSIYNMIPLLFQYFANLMQAHYAPKKDDRSLGEWLGISPWMAREYVSGMKMFSAMKTLQIIAKFREVDAKSKGLDNPNTSASELMKELVFFILH
ncbi:MAG: DNA polymerase III subunit delta [Bacteroidaceae bacterium]|nr:DNA polymerase III subunit delta [Bacteroidaceae bacterium]